MSITIKLASTTAYGIVVNEPPAKPLRERPDAAGNDNFILSARLSRTFAVTERVRVEGMAEAFNALNHRNNLTRNGTFGAGAYPANPSPAFDQVTAVNDPRVVQLALRVRF